MAGFDFVVPVAFCERLLAKLLLGKFQQAASKTNVILRFRWNGLSTSVSYEHYYVTIDGSFPDIQILLKQLWKYIQGYSDGYVAASPSIKKSRIGDLIMISFSRAIFDFQNEAKGLLADLSTNLSPEFPITLNSFIFNFPNESGLSKSGASLTIALLNYFDNSITTEQLAEQLHTTSEHAMNYLMGIKARKMSYQDLINACPISDNQKKALTDLKSLRREAKHRGKAISDNELEAIVNKSVAAIHSFAASMHSLTS